MSSPVAPQHTFFYDADWTPEMDSIFVDSLAREARRGGFYVGRPNIHALLIARADIKRETGIFCDLSTCKFAVEMLESRYDAWKALMRCPDVAFHPGLNRVRTDSKTWKWLSDVRPLVMAYYHQGEPEAAKLEEIFGVNRRLWGQ